VGELPPVDPVAPVSGLPRGESTYHSAPKPVDPCPLVCRDPVSPANRYRGCPLYVTCSDPFALFVVPRSELLTPLPAVGVPVVSSGGHAEAHAPVQVLLAPVSACHRYRVLPWESIRMGPKLLLARSTVPDDALVEDGADDAPGTLAPVVVCLLELPLPHAAIAIALKATAVAAASGERRLVRIVTLSIGFCRLARNRHSVGRAS
jgi:hypothetical protein